MCLSSIIQLNETPDPTIRVGYKVGFACEHFFVTLFDRRTYKYGEWYRCSPSHSNLMTGELDTNKEMISTGVSFYPLGFHIFPSRRIASACYDYDNNTHIVTVHYKDMVASGLEYGSKVHVAQYIMFKRPNEGRLMQW